MSYAGDVTSRQAYQSMLADTNAVLIDCRTEAEWILVGIPVSPRTVFAEWTRFPDNSRNRAFLEELAAAGVKLDQPVYFICRSGQRSQMAAIAATGAGYTNAYNVADGFEGPLGPAGRRGVAGWKVEGLPWRQS